MSGKKINAGLEEALRHVKGEDTGARVTVIDPEILNRALRKSVTIVPDPRISEARLSGIEAFREAAVRECEAMVAEANQFARNAQARGDQSAAHGAACRYNAAWELAAALKVLEVK